MPTANIDADPDLQQRRHPERHGDHTEDVARAIGAAAAAVPGVQVINALRVGGVQQVQLDVMVAQVSRSELRSMAFNFLTDSQELLLRQHGRPGRRRPAAGRHRQRHLDVSGWRRPAGVPGTPNGTPTNLLFGVLHNGWGFLGFLEALRDRGRGQARWPSRTW